MNRPLWTVGVIMMMTACSHAVRQQARPVAPAGRAAAAAAPPAAVAPVPRPAAKKPQPSAADVERARTLLARGEHFYRKGDYNGAERVLKQSITLYPFLPAANLLLGKIFLIRGSATHDLSLIHSARLMFEMARALDPQLREASVLLELFNSAPPE